MGYLKIYCDKCGGKWQVYHRDIKSDSVNECPHCYARIEPHTWMQIVEGFCIMRDAEMELIKDRENNNSLFMVDYVADSVPKNAKNRDRTFETLIDLWD